MKAKLDPRLKMARVMNPRHSIYADEQNGWFEINGPCKRRLLICAANGLGWDHVSVSVARSHETPTWDEMCFVKELFFEPDEPAFQYHPPQSRYVNVHEGCLHLWRFQGEPMPMPPLALV